MKIEIYIGTQLLDYDEEINAIFSVGDIRDISLGNLNRTYTINIPLTKTNRSIIKHSHIPGSTDEVSATGRIFINGVQLIYGAVKVLSFSEHYAKIIITADDWIDDILNTDLQDVDLSADDHTLSVANIVASWSASDAFYRYPMINFGQLVTPATGNQPHDWHFNDFIPLFRVIDILEYIFSPWIIESDWFDSTYAKKLYVLGTEKRAEADFIQNKDMEVYINNNTDNYTEQNYGVMETSEINLSKDPVNFTSEAADEGGDFNPTTDVYTIPETGTYRLQAQLSATYTSGLPNFTCNESEFTVQILKGGATVLAEDTETDAAGDAAFTTITLDTGYIHLEAGDEITVSCLLYGEFTNGGAIDYLRIYLVAGQTTSYFKNSWDNWNRYPGIGKTITASDYLPDIKCIDFVKAVKHLANLLFFVDRSNHKIYIEPAQSFRVTDHDYDLTPYQDYEELSIETISRNYHQSIELGFLEDMEDQAYKQYRDYLTPPDRKVISLSSIYAKSGEDKWINNLFAHSITGGFPEIREWGERIVTIYGDEEYDETKGYPLYRASGFKPRLLTWEGLTAGISFDLGGSTYNTYPKALPVDFSDLYDNYWISSIHQIDKNVIVTIRVKLPLQVLNQLTTVLSDASAEGFRPKYKINVRGEDMYGYLNSVTTNGEISECEFIIKN